MSLVFPNALAAKTTSLALAKGSFWFGMVCISAVVISLTAIQVDRGQVRALPALLALAVLAALGVIVASRLGTRPPVIAASAVVAFLAIGAYAAMLLPNLRPIDSSIRLDFPARDGSGAKVSRYRTTSPSSQEQGTSLCQYLDYRILRSAQPPAALAGGSAAS